MAVPESFVALAAHAAPGLHFPRHQGAQREEYVLPAPHFFGRPANEAQLALVRYLAGTCPAARAELLEFYARWNGARLCCTPHILSGEPEASLEILPVERWERSTEEITTGGLSWMFEELQDMYVPGCFLVIAESPSEETLLVLFLEGDFEGHELAGRLEVNSRTGIDGARPGPAFKWKHAMHLIRLLLAGIVALREGTVPVSVAAHRDWLLAIRRGEVDWPEVDAWRLELHREFDAAYAETKLPERPDYARANGLLIKARWMRV